MGGLYSFTSTASPAGTYCLPERKKLSEQTTGVEQGRKGILNPVSFSFPLPLDKGKTFNQNKAGF